MVIEGPQSEARAQAVIAEAKRLIPNKPIRYVVNTHTHIDHSSGLRAFVAEGATIITHAVQQDIPGEGAQRGAYADARRHE